MSPLALGVRWVHHGKANSYVVRVPNNALNGSTGRRWYAIANGLGLGHYRNKRNAVAAVYRALQPKVAQ